MEWDGKVSASSFTCSVSGRVLAPGEVFYSALLAEGGGFRRRDVAAEAWLEADRTGVISWWRQRVPVPDRKRKQLRLDQALLLRLFEDLKGARERPRQCLCFVIALCLVRARAFSLISVDEDGSDAWLVVDHKADGLRLRVRDPRMGAAEQEAVQAQLLEIIGDGEPA